jgi:peptidylprolyl isomerase
MRFVFAIMALIALSATPAVAQDLSSEKGKLSYSVGWDIGKDIER